MHRVFIISFGRLSQMFIVKIACRLIGSTSLFRLSNAAGPHKHMQCKRNSRSEKKKEIKLIQTPNDRFGAGSWFSPEHTIDVGRMRAMWQMVWLWVKKKTIFDWINNFKCYSKYCTWNSIQDRVCGSSFRLIFWWFHQRVLISLNFVYGLRKRY